VALSLATSMQTPAFEVRHIEVLQVL